MKQGNTERHNRKSTKDSHKFGGNTNIKKTKNKSKFKQETNTSVSDNVNIEKEKETVLTLEHSRMKIFNGFLLTRSIIHKYLVKVRPLASVK